MAVTTQRGLDLRFQQFDKWYVLGKGRQTRHGQFWICQCACGRQAELHEAALTEGRAQSCGCDYVDRSGRRYPITDYTGWQIGERLVLERVLKPSGKTRVGLWYRVRCRCGQEESLSLSLVLGRQASSCKTCAGDQRVSVQTRRWYGAWWVIRRVESTGHRQAMFLCHCRLCGREKAVSALTLATGRSKNCGCRRGNSQDAMLHATFGRWTVLEQAGCTPRGLTLYRCQCSCPAHTIKVVRGVSLRNGSSQSCGCLKNALTSQRSRGRSNAARAATQSALCRDTGATP